MKIKLLSQNLINQIAAGEVIERPASVIKELMENAIDAKASEIEVKIIDAGKSFISVSDNGYGMDKESLELCVLSHATSKLNSENLFNIHTFGFRGEALPSIASVSRLHITSSSDKSSDAWTIKLEGCNNLGLSPTNRIQGTSIEVRDLFFATPARLKFLKSDLSEANNCRNTFDRIALAHPEISFKLQDANKEKSCYEKANSFEKRVEDVLGDIFISNTFRIDVQKDNLRLHGFIGVPTFNKITTSHQYFFVNSRFVKDKIFASALRGAYSGLVPTGRYPAAVLYLDIPFDEVDINAHPAKIEVRFRDSEKIRYFIISELKKKLLSFDSTRSTTESIKTFYEQKVRTRDTQKTSDNISFSNNCNGNQSGHYNNSDLGNTDLKTIGEQKNNNDMTIDGLYKFPHNKAFFLGNALYQINNTYIVSGDEDNLIIIDQHAAAERIILEKLKDNLSLDSQNLLLPEVYPLTESGVELVENNRNLFLKFGIHYEKLANDLIVINAIPAILETCDAKSLMNDIIDELGMFGDFISMDEKINRILSSISCHTSLRAGKKLTIQEMNSLLRQMENTNNIAQCCHGRPSYVKFLLKDLDKLFERS